MLREYAGVAGTEGMVAIVVGNIGLFENAPCFPERLAAAGGKAVHPKAFSRRWEAVAAARGGSPAKSRACSRQSALNQSCQTKIRATAFRS